jgi:glycosyltransferase involved in cell wall biosynthesis
MRILIGTPFLYPAISYGGAARSAYNLAEMLQQIGHDVTVLTTDVWDSRSRYSENGHRTPFQVIRVPNLSNTMAYYWQFYTPLGILKHAERLLAQSDILHLHTFRNLHNDLLARTAVKQGIPFVLTGHGTIPRFERFLLIKRVYDVLIGSWQLKNAAGYIAVSQAEQDAMRRFGLSEAKIRVIPNGIADVPAGISAGKFREEWRIETDEKMILFVGKITRRKGLQHLIRAYDSLRKEARLVIAGNDMDYGGHLRRLIASLGLKDRVTWCGLLNDQQKYEALVDADLTVYPSTKEVFGLVPLESIMAGTPVIVCDDDGCAEVIRNVGGGHLVPWNNPSALAQAIRERLSLGKNHEDLRQAQEKIRARFNWNKIAQEVVNFYKDATEQTR